ncbi:helix-turn-helix domain-containing protein [Thermococcus sp. Bubb.Bath]|uniref:helix-turn-helix domain-containing protein n=1 Tax=Thermococcus sp. Bubb.Bath TaxID=1638242 RepID=UPI00143C2852|nr:helix-turn-helix domain-containing protein [Thermococcus sp. Bubb.Bath]NJF25170.1 transcriptional regulator [Thermococcus sp. Bubb.Bath]
MNGLSKIEVRALLKLKEEKTITELANKLGLSIYRTSVLVASLERKGLVKTEKRGKYKIASLSEAKPAELFRKLASRFGHMPLDEILSGRNLALLAVLKHTPLSAHELCIKGNLSRSTLYYAIDKLSDYGLIGKKDGGYFLMERYELLHGFAVEFYELQNSIKAREFSEDSALIWSGVGEFILSMGEYRGKDVGNFHLTGLERFSDFGVDIIGTGRHHYYYSEKAKRLSLEDVIVHALLIDFGPRTILYSIVLLLACKGRINQKKLFRLGRKYDVSVSELLGYLEGKEVKRYPYPPMEEVREIFKMYFGEGKWVR